MVIGINIAKEKKRGTRRRKPTKEEEQGEKKRKAHYITSAQLRKSGTTFYKAVNFLGNGSKKCLYLIFLHFFKF